MHSFPPLGPSPPMHDAANAQPTSDPSPVVLFHQSQLKLLLEDIGERYTRAMRRIVAILNEIEEMLGPDADSEEVSKVDMLDSFRKANMSVEVSKQYAHEAPTLDEFIDRLADWVDAAEVKVAWFLKDSKYFVNTSMLRNKIHLDEWNDPLTDAYPPPGHSAHSDGTPVIIPQGEDAPAVLEILQSMVDLVKRQRQVLWPSSDQSAEGKYMRERSYDYEQRIEGFMQLILEEMHPDRLKSFIHTLAKTPAALSDWISRLSRTSTRANTDTHRAGNQSVSVQQILRPHTEYHFEDIVRGLLEAQEGHGLVATPYHGPKEDHSSDSRSSEERAVGQRIELRQGEGKPVSTMRVKCSCWPNCQHRAGLADVQL